MLCGCIRFGSKAKAASSDVESLVQIQSWSGEGLYWLVNESECSEDNSLWRYDAEFKRIQEVGR